MVPSGRDNLCMSDDISYCSKCTAFQTKTLGLNLYDVSHAKKLNLKNNLRKGPGDAVWRKFGSAIFANIHSESVNCSLPQLNQFMYDL